MTLYPGVIFETKYIHKNAFFSISYFYLHVCIQGITIIVLTRIMQMEKITLSAEFSTLLSVLLFSIDSTGASLNAARVVLKLHNVQLQH